MDIGSMRRRIKIEKHETIVDKIGNRTSGWNTYHECYAYVNQTSASEYGVSPERISEESVTFIVRWCEKLRSMSSKEYRIKFSNATYNIVGIDDVQLKHEKLRILTEKEVREDGKKD